MYCEFAVFLVLSGLTYLARSLWGSVCNLLCFQDFCQLCEAWGKHDAEDIHIGCNQTQFFNTLPGRGGAAPSKSGAIQAFQGNKVTFEDSD